MGATSRVCVRLITSVISLATAAALVACADDQPAFIDAGLDGDPVDARPGPVTNFRAENVATGLSLSWTNPSDADLAGILVVGGAGVPVTFAPVDGMSYTVGTEVGTGQGVLVSTITTSLPSFQAIAGVDFEFSAWAVDAAGQYSLVATTTGRTNVLGVQEGAIQLFQNGTVVVTQQPIALRLSGTVVYDDLADTMSADIVVENQTGRVVFNLKGLVTATSQGTVTNPLFPPVGGQPMAYYGPAGAAPGATPTSNIALTGIDGTMDPVVINMRFVDAPSLLLQGGDGGGTKGGGGGERGISIIDTSAVDLRGTSEFPPQDCNRAEPRGLAITADGRAAFTGNKSEPRISRLSLLTLEITQSANLTTSTPYGMVSDVALSPDETRLYAVLHDGAHFHGRAGNINGGCGGVIKKPPQEATTPGTHRNRNRVVWDAGMFGGVIFGGPVITGTATFVELDTETLAELRRIPLSAAPVETNLALAGNHALVANNNGQILHVIELTQFTEVDTDAGTAGIQALSLGADHFENIAVSSDGAEFTIALQGETGGYDLVTYDTATLTRTSQNSPVVDFNRVVGLTYDGDGNLIALAGTRTKGPSGFDLERLDGANVVSIKSLREGDEAQTLVFTGDRYYVGTNNATVRVFDRTGTELDIDGDAENGVTPIFLDDGPRPHGVAGITPF
jgi:hypothetical protein